MNISTYKTSLRETSMRVVSLALMALITVLPGVALSADFVVIVNKANTVAVDKTVVAKIYQGELKSWPDGTPAAPIDLPEDSPSRAAFSNDVVGKTVANLKALWAQMIFSGKALPPKVVAGDDDVKKAVSAAKGGVGYIKASAVDDTVKVAFK
jgi:ABC-type phosphate transport system substrate-binding protein